VAHLEPGLDGSTGDYLGAQLVHSGTKGEQLADGYHQFLRLRCRACGSTHGALASSLVDCALRRTAPTTRACSAV
jgi:hypothetical protein